MGNSEVGGGIPCRVKRFRQGGYVIRLWQSHVRRFTVENSGLFRVQTRQYAGARRQTTGSIAKIVCKPATVFGEPVNIWRGNFCVRVAIATKSIHSQLVAHDPDNIWLHQNFSIWFQAEFIALTNISTDFSICLQPEANRVAAARGILSNLQSDNFFQATIQAVRYETWSNHRI